jgi:hypothetical protein
VQAQGTETRQLIDEQRARVASLEAEYRGVPLNLWTGH